MCVCVLRLFDQSSILLFFLVFAPDSFPSFCLRYSSVTMIDTESKGPMSGECPLGEIAHL